SGPPGGDIKLWGGAHAPTVWASDCGVSRPRMEFTLRSAGLSDAADHDDRAISGWWRHGHGGAVPQRGNAGDFRATRRHRECRRCCWYSWRRPRGALRWRWLYAQHWYIHDAYADGWPLCPAIRSVEGSGAGHSNRQRAASDCWQEEPAAG